jgi:hypothetical protein
MALNFMDAYGLLPVLSVFLPLTAESMQSLNYILTTLSHTSPHTTTATIVCTTFSHTCSQAQPKGQLKTSPLVNKKMMSKS